MGCSVLADPRFSVRGEVSAMKRAGVRVEDLNNPVEAYPPDMLVSRKKL